MSYASPGLSTGVVSYATMAGKPQTAMKPLLIFALTFANALAADHPDPALAGMDAATLARIPARMKAFVDDGTAAGFVTLIARHGQVVSLEAVGFQDREAKTPMRTDTLFQIQSMTKPVTCAAIMILMERGRLSLIDPVEKYLPEFKQKSRDSRLDDAHLRDCGSFSQGFREAGSYAGRGGERGGGPARGVRARGQVEL